MKKIMITYRATIDSYVPIAQRGEAKKRTPTRSKLFIIRERLRLV